MALVHAEFQHPTQTPDLSWANVNSTREKTNTPSEQQQFQTHQNTDTHPADESVLSLSARRAKRPSAPEFDSYKYKQLIYKSWHLKIATTAAIIILFRSVY